MAGAGDVAFKVLTGGLGVATIYLTGVCAVNLFRGYSWHTSQPKPEKDASPNGRQ